MSDHSTMTGANLHQPWHYIQETDPGAVGAGLTWFKKSSKTLSYRNDLNTSWISILTSSSSNALPAGTTWTQFINAFNSLDPGDTLILPNDVIYQESPLNGYSKAYRIQGSGPNSEIRLTTSMSTHSQIQLGYNVVGNRTEFCDFKLSQDRTLLTLSGFGWRGVTVYSGGRGIYFNRMSFDDITSSVFAIMAEGWVDTDPLFQTIDGVYITDCTATEWYESFVDFHEASALVTNIIVDRCAGTTTERHPYGPVSAPYALNIEVEDPAANGQMQNIIMSNNSFTCAESITSTLGLSIKSSGGANIFYSRIYAINNTFAGWSAPFQIVSINGGLPAYGGQNAFIYIYKNTLSGEDSITARIDPSGQVGDFVFFGDNDLYPASGHTAISTPGTWDPPHVEIVQDPPNRIH